MNHWKENVSPFAGTAEPPSLADRPKDVKEGRSQQHREWRRQLDSSVCPLSTWESYVQWVKATSDEEEEYGDVLRKCVEELPMEKHQSDCRYLRLWVKYAGCLALPEQRRVMEYLEANSVGEGHALFYIAFGTLLEKLRNYEAAQATYERGLERNAEPLAKVQANYDKFRGRMENRRRRAASSSGAGRTPAAAASVASVSVSGSKHKQTTPFKDGTSSAVSPATAKAETGHRGPEGSKKKVKQQPMPSSCGYDASLLLLGGEGGGPLCFEEVRAMKWWSNAKRREAAAAPPSQQPQSLGRPPYPSEQKQRQEQQEEKAPEGPSVVRKLQLQTPTAELRSSNDLAPTPLPDSAGGVGGFGGGDTDSTFGLNNAFRGQNLLSGMESEGLEAGASASVTPSVTITTRAAMSEINGMFQERLPLDEEDGDDDEEGKGVRRSQSREPTVTVNTRAALSEINGMFQERLPLDDDSEGEKEVERRDSWRSPSREPTMTINTRTAMSEINGMFQEHIPLDDEEGAVKEEGERGVRGAAEREPTMTINTRAAMSEINGMFQERLPLDDEEEAEKEEERDFRGAAEGEPTVTVNTRAALGAIDAMFQEDLPFGSPNETSPAPAATPGPARAPHAPVEVEVEEVGEQPHKRPAEVATEGSSGGTHAPVVMDPFADELRQRILEALCPPLTQWPLVVQDDEEEVKEALEQLRSFSGSSSDEQAFLELGDNAFSVRAILGSGAYAKCFEVDVLDGGGGEGAEEEDAEGDQESLAALKVESPANAWEFYIGRALRGRLAEASGGKDGGAAAAAAARRFVRMKQLRLGDSASFLVTSLGMYGTLQELLNAYRAKGQPALPESVALFYSMDLCSLMADLHSCGIIHADVKPDNLLIRHPGSGGWASWDPRDPGSWGASSGLQLIDFGRSIDAEALPEEAEFLADFKPGCFRCIEMQEGRTWKYQVDSYGVASVMHFMLFGEYIKVQRVTDPSKNGEVSYRLRSPFRRYWAQGVWEEAFRLLLNAAPGGGRPPWSALAALFRDHWASAPEADRAQLQTDLRKQAILLHKE